MHAYHTMSYTIMLLGHGKYDVCPAYINRAVSGSLATTTSGTIGN